mmetsp:Transcript_28553/g.44128  ORF Transcript_28553/g.44128 Transcript_28553/m.44128 type:complete len:334 (-) Transcript_28553:161-1162(-)
MLVALPAVLNHALTSAGSSNSSFDPEFWTPIYLSSLAGASTCIGASVAFVISADVGEDSDQYNTRGLEKESRQVVSADLLSFSLSLAASVMCTVCIVSIIPESLSLRHSIGEWCLFFSMGWGVYALLSNWLSTMPDEDEWGNLLAPPPPIEGDIITSKEQSSSWRLTILLFLALLLHNFPEGLAVAFASSASSNSSVDSSPSSLASIVTLSIALHNIPEGIAIAVPCMAARPNKPWLAFGLASLSGLAEPFGAFFCLTMMRLNRSNGHDIASSSVNMGGSLAFVAGIMMAVSICELIPQALEQQKESDDPNSFNTGIVLGGTVMVLTELCIRD